MATIASNAGQLLWSGILTDDHAAAVAERVMRSDLFSGWGIRTLADGQAPYNPIQYHNGTVWPHDNALIATGLRHYGHDEAARTIIVALLDAAAHFEHRLPEVFAGFDRHFTGFPVEYPTACSPQAWASGTPLAAHPRRTRPRAPRRQTKPRPATRNARTGRNPVGRNRRPMAAGLNHPTRPHIAARPSTDGAARTKHPLGTRGPLSLEV